MKIKLSNIQKILLTDLAGFDPIGIILEDFGPGHGRITITYADTAWTKPWGAMGNTTVAEFFCSASNEYLVGKLSRYGNDEDLEQLDRIVSMVKTGLDAKAALDIVANPLPDTAPLATARNSSIVADEI